MSETPRQCYYQGGQVDQNCFQYREIETCKVHGAAPPRTVRRSSLFHAAGPVQRYRACCIGGPRPPMQHARYSRHDSGNSSRHLSRRHQRSLQVRVVDLNDLNNLRRRRWWRRRQGPRVTRRVDELERSRPPTASLSAAGEAALTGPPTQKSGRLTITPACSPFPPAGMSRTRTRPMKCRTGIQPEDSWSYGYPEMGGE